MDRRCMIFVFIYFFQLGGVEFSRGRRRSMGSNDHLKAINNCALSLEPKTSSAHFRRRCAVTPHQVLICYSRTSRGEVK